MFVPTDSPNKPQPLHNAAGGDGSDGTHFEPSEAVRPPTLSLFVIAPYLGAILLSLVSFHTTYYGMRSFYGLGETGGRQKSGISDPVANLIAHYFHTDIENVFAICFAAVVQGGILCASAYLSRLMLSGRVSGAEQNADVRLRWTRRFVAASLLLLLPISIGFSYGARLEWLIGPEQKNIIQTSGAHSDGEEILNALKGMMIDENHRQIAAIGDMPEFKAWAANMETLTKVTARAPEAIRAYLKSVESTEAEKRASDRRVQADAQKMAVDFEREAELIRMRIAQIERDSKKIEDLVSTGAAPLADYDAKIAEYEAEMKKEQAGTGSCGAAGEGRCFAAYKAQRDKSDHDKSAAIQKSEAAARAAADQVAALKKEKIQKETELANIVERARLAGSGTATDSSASALDLAEDLPKKLSDLQPVIGAKGAELRGALDALSAGISLEKYVRVTQACRNLLPITLVADLKETLKDSNCDSAPVESAVYDVAKFEERRDQFGSVCRALPAPSGGGGTEAYVGQIVNSVNNCFELSGLGSVAFHRPRMNELSQQLAATIANRSAGVDYLTFTTGELRDGKRVAFLALFLAFAVDGLVFLFTTLGEMPRMRAAAAAPLPLSSDERQNMFAQLQATNDILDASDPSKFRHIRNIMTCIDVAHKGGTIRIDLAKVESEADRQEMWRRLFPFCVSNLAWKDSQDNVLHISERAMSLLAGELKRLCGRDGEQAPALAKIASIDPAARPDLDAYARSRRLGENVVTVAAQQGSVP